MTQPDTSPTLSASQSPENLAGVFAGNPYILVNLDKSSGDSLSVISAHETLVEARNAIALFSSRKAKNGGASATLMILHAREAMLVRVEVVETIHESQLFGQVRPRRKGEKAEG